MAVSLTHGRAFLMVQSETFVMQSFVISVSEIRQPFITFYFPNKPAIGFH